MISAKEDALASLKRYNNNNDLDDTEAREIKNKSKCEVGKEEKEKNQSIEEGECSIWIEQQLHNVTNDRVTNSVP